MAVHIIEREKGAVYRCIGNNRILEITPHSGKIEGLKACKYVVVHRNNNIREDIMPSVDKYNLIDITSCVPSDNYVYFTGIKEHTNGKVFITLYSYDIDTKELKDLYSYEDMLSLYPLQKKVKAFILDDNYIIVQNSYLRSNMADNYQGYFDAEQILYNVKVKNAIQIADSVFSLGIDKMIPVSKNTCVIKIGFSVFDDERYKKISREESVPEIVGLINPRQIVTDILLKQRNIYIDVLDKVQYDVTIPSIKVTDGVIIYSKVTPAKEREEVVFYNINTGKTYNCVKNHVDGPDKLAKAYMFMDEPHVFISKREQAYLYNLVSNTVSMQMNGKGISLKAIKNDYVVLEREKNSIWGYPVYTVEIYEFPGERLIFKEKAEYYDFCVTDGKSIYLFTE